MKIGSNSLFVLNDSQSILANSVTVNMQKGKSESFFLCCSLMSCDDSRNLDVSQISVDSWQWHIWLKRKAFGCRQNQLDPNFRTAHSLIRIVEDTDMPTWYTAV